MNKTLKMLLIIVGVLVLLGILFASMYNGIVKAEEAVESKFASIEADLQRRADLIPNLVETVKEFADHEEEIFTEISSARTNLLNANTPEEMADADAEATNAIGRLLAISEAYPELKSSDNFINLQDELAGTENRIAVSRKDYNDEAKNYNTTIKSFPNNMIANMFGFEAKEYFEASEGAENAPTIDFE